MITEILNASKMIKNGRTINSVFNHTVQEIGELATEIAITNGDSNKAAGHDGIIGESIDAILCLIDLIYTYKPDITEDELDLVTKIKLVKWMKQNE